MLSTSSESITLHVLTDDQLAALEERMVERCAAIVAEHWLPRAPMSRDALASFLGVSEDTVYRWTINGTIGHMKVGSIVLYLPDQIAAFVAAHRSDVERAAAA